MFFRRLALVLCLVPLIAAACGSDNNNQNQQPKPKGCTVGDNSTCADGLECQAVAGGNPSCFCSIDKATGCADAGADYVCEAVNGGNSDCFAPLYVKGKVFNLVDQKPIEGARVVARDANNAAQSGIAVTDPNGDYTLRVPAPRDKNGTPVQSEVTMRADAAGFLTFPKPPRVALPVELSAASGDPLTVQTSATDIGMLPLQDTSNLGTIEGTVKNDAPRGTLVVAGGATSTGGGVTGVADFDGTYAVFNVPAGNVDVHGYKAGLQLKPTTAAVTAGQVTKGVDLETLGAATAVVNGSIQLVNPGAGKQTSVILAVDETFDDLTASGEAPPGLRAYPVSGAFSIPNVPDGNYVVLAAFENDNLVRDPDQSIGGTKIVRISVSGGNVTLSEGFKVTGALDVVSPDKEQVVSGTPTFVWGDDSGEDHYEIVVFDAFGNKTWEDLQVPGVSGSKTVQVQYGGPALTSGVMYQFRATSIKQGGSAIARTEDLRGVFLYQ
jgi:hypothetical protein